MKKVITIILALLLPVGVVHAQEEIIVDAAGGGDFTELQPAVDAASPGQLIRVRHGMYEGATISKSVRIVGDPWQQVPGGGLTDARFSTAIRIEDLPRESSCVIADVSAAVIGRNCQGSIHLAYTFLGLLDLERCENVVIFEHFGRVRAVESTVLISKSLVSSIGIAPTLEVIDSTVTAMGSTIGVVSLDPTDMSVHVSKGGRFRYTSNIFVTGGSGAPIPAISLESGGSAERIDDNYLVVNFQNFDKFTPFLEAPAGTSLVALAGSLSTHPVATKQGGLYLDAASFSLFYLGDPPANGNFKKAVPLPSDFLPSRHFDLLPPEDLAHPDAKLMGIPVTLQAAVIVNGEAILSLPYPLVL